ncbi:MAG: glycosyltransferase family 4 protein [Rhodospirillaceae bacterium]|nr:glycosyltransferase family 4 protein [Rhodospirillaceae bacterium]
MNPPARQPHLLLTSDAVGGVWTFATDLAAAMARVGWRVTLATPGPAPRPDQCAALAAAGVRLERTGLTLDWMDGRGREVERGRRVLEALLARLHPDLVHCNGFREAGCCRDVPVVLTAHSCVRSWWRACRGGEPPAAAWAAYLRGVEAALAAADVWVAPTTAFRDELEMLYAPPRRGLAIWNGAPLPPAPHGKDPIVLAAGRLWDEAKNLAALAAATPAIGWPVRVAGPCARPGQVRTEPAPVAAGAAWLGALPHATLLAHMRRAAVFVAPSLYEPFGLGALEAAGAGCALVLSDIPAHRELWEGAALFCEPRDPRGLAAAVNALCRDTTLRSRLQRAARRRARRYTLARTVARYRRLYEGLLRRADGPTVRFQPAEVLA